MCQRALRHAEVIPAFRHITKFEAFALLANMSIGEEPRFLPRFVLASAAGHLSHVQALIDEWRSMSESERASLDSIYALQPALTAAVKGNQIPVVSYLLSQNMPPDDDAIVAAIEASSEASLELFLSHGWDINKYAMTGAPPHLGYAIVLPISRQPSLNNH